MAENPEIRWPKIFTTEGFDTAKKQDSERTQRLDAEKFARLKAAWIKEQGPTSRFQEIVLCKPYQQIIGMGKAALPFLVQELRTSHLYWIWALEAITCESPVGEGESDNYDAIRNSWLEWADKNGF